MPRHISFVFPGQGSQSMGMLDRIDPAYINHFRPKVDSALDLDLIEIIKHGPIEKLNRSSITQPAILLTSYLLYKELLSKINIEPDIICGHSLGEYTALVVGNSIDLEEALKLVHKRGLLMEECNEGSMYAILNCDLLTISKFCDEVSNKTKKIVSPANINSPNQIVIAGNIDAVEEVVMLLKNHGVKRCIKLQVSVASHCALMSEAAIKFKEHISTIDLKLPNIELLHNFNAQSSKDTDELKLNMINQLTHPVQWTKTMEILNKKNSIVVECGPNKVLSGIAKSNNITDIVSTSMDNYVQRLTELV